MAIRIVWPVRAFPGSIYVFADENDPAASHESTSCLLEVALLL
jgi:hypothetical protein